MTFKHAITRTPCRRIVEGLSSENEFVPDYEKSLKQHKEYVGTLEACGLDVIVLEADERYPDSVFVEDTAVLTDEFACLCNLGAPSRKGEEESVIEALEKYYDDIERVKAPGTIEGGDVMKVDDEFFVGLSERTDENGIDQFTNIVERYGYDVQEIRLKDMLHLKSGAAYLGDDIMLAAGQMKDKFEGFDVIEVPDDEKYSANCVVVNEKVLIPKGFPKTREQIEKSGFSIIEIDVSEFKKIDGGISCLSLRF